MTAARNIGQNVRTALHPGRCGIGDRHIEQVFNLEAHRQPCGRVRIDAVDRISGRVLASGVSCYDACTLRNESANRVDEYPCRIMCSTNPSRREKFSGLMPCIFHLDILRGKDCRCACTNSCGWQ